MNFERLRKGLFLIRQSPGLSGKITTARQLALVLTRSRFSAPTQIVSDTVAANAWAEFHLLRLVNRDVNVRIDRTAAPKVWFILPDLDAKLVFGGYIALFQFAKFLHGLGIETGFLVLSKIAPRAELLRSFERNAVVHEVLARSDLARLGVSRTLRLGAADMLVCYNWTTALVAAKMARFLDDPAYYYFVQEDERIFYPNDSSRFLCESVFHQTPRPRLICNSQKLLDHLTRERLVYSDTIAGVFEQGLPGSDLPDRLTLENRRPRRFVFYGRPEDHARRNLMTVALMALAKAVQAGVFAKEPWEFCMLGSQQMGERFPLEGIEIRSLPNQPYADYRRTLTTFDVGMSLMYAPHPSVPPFEMVRSGVITVVNTTMERPVEWYRGISENFEPAAPTVEALAEAIGRAVRRVDDVAARLAASSTYHPATWEESFADLPGALRHRIFAQIKRETVR